MGKNEYRSSKHATIPANHSKYHHNKHDDHYNNSGASSGFGGTRCGADYDKPNYQSPGDTLNSYKKRLPLTTAWEQILSKNVFSENTRDFLNTF